VTVEVTKDNVAKVLATIRYMTSQELLIGVPDVNAARPVTKEDPTPINNASIGYINEYGAPSRNIPPRPHMVPGVEAVMPEIIKRLQKAGEQALSEGGDREIVTKQMMACGQIAVSSVQKKIQDVLSPPLAPLTIRNRQRRGHLGTTPLFEFGYYLKSITYVLRKIKR
jgi:hypothetical protein